jgi:hypothetical protein
MKPCKASHCVSLSECWAKVLQGSKEELQGSPTSSEKSTPALHMFTLTKVIALKTKTAA